MLTKQEAIEINRLITQCKFYEKQESLKQLKQFVGDITDTYSDIIHFDHSGEMPLFNSNIIVPRAKTMEGWL